MPEFLNVHGSDNKISLGIFCNFCKKVWGKNEFDKVKNKHTNDII